MERVGGLFVVVVVSFIEMNTAKSYCKFFKLVFIFFRVTFGI